MAGTTWFAFTAGTKAKASEVNSNFDWIEGALVPMNAGSKTDTAYDLGESAFKWRDAYIGRTAYFYNTAATGFFKIYRDGANLHLNADSGATTDVIVDSSGNLIIRPGRAFYLDGGIGTRIEETVGDHIYFYTDNIERFRIDNAGSLVMQSGKGFYYDSGTDDFAVGSGGSIFIKCSNATCAEFKSDNTVDFPGSITANGVSADSGISSGGNESLKWDVIQVVMNPPAIGTSGSYIRTNIGYSISTASIRVINTAGFVPSSSYTAVGFISSPSLSAEVLIRDNSITMYYGTGYATNDTIYVFVMYT